MIKYVLAWSKQDYCHLKTGRFISSLIICIPSISFLAVFHCLEFVVLYWIAVKMDILALFPIIGRETFSFSQLSMMLAIGYLSSSSSSPLFLVFLGYVFVYLASICHRAHYTIFSYFLYSWCSGILGALQIWEDTDLPLNVS